MAFRLITTLKTKTESYRRGSSARPNMQIFLCTTRCSTNTTRNDNTRGCVSWSATTKFVQENYLTQLNRLSVCYTDKVSLRQAELTFIHNIY